MTTVNFNTDPGTDTFTVYVNGVHVDPTTLAGYGATGHTISHADAIAKGGEWTIRDDGLVENLVLGSQLFHPAPNGLATVVNGVVRQIIGMAPAFWVVGGTVPVIPQPQPQPPHVDVNPDGTVPSVTAAPPAWTQAPVAAPVPLVWAKVPGVTVAPHSTGGWLVTLVHRSLEIEHRVVIDVKELLATIERWGKLHL